MRLLHHVSRPASVPHSPSHRFGRGRSAGLVILPLFVASLWASAAAPEPVTGGAPVVISCGAIGKEFELCRSAAQGWAAETGHRVTVLSAPSASSERLAQDQLLLAAGSPDIDVFSIDTTWPGMIGDFLLDLRGRVPESILKQHFPSFIANNTVAGKIVALPWFIDAGVLFYRKDLLERYGVKPPATWPELARIAHRVQDAERKAGNTSLWGFVFQARAYEGLTCDALEWIEGMGGGSLVSSTGEVTIDNPHARDALELAASWIGTISPRGVLGFTEEESRAVFQSGDAVFMRNWPYAWKLAEASGSPIRGKTGIAPLPGPSTLGGWSLAVSRFSRQPEAAVSLVLYLSRPEEQKRRALEAGLNPTLPALYDDSELRRANPVMPRLREIFEHTLARPSQVTGGKYNRVSAAFWDTVHEILSGSPAGPELASLRDALNRIGRNGKW